MRFAIVIMAAGKGTRLKSKRPKVLHEIGGKSLLAHVIAAATQIVLPNDTFVVIGHEADRVKAAVGSTGVQFILQGDQLGTGHAIQSARDAVIGYENLLVLSGDVPLIRPETIAMLRDFHLAQGAAMTILTAVSANPEGYGRVIRKVAGQPEVAQIVEQKALTAEQMGAPEINSGIYAFAVGPLFQHIEELKTANSHGEYYLTDMAAILAKGGQRVVALQAADSNEVLGANTIAEMMELDRTMRSAAATRLMAAGVTIFRPDTVLIDMGVTVGPDTVIEPYVQLLGATKIGEDCRIRSYSVLENVNLGNGVVVLNGCLITDSVIDTGARVGPFSHLRPGSEIGEEAHVGAFVETKKVKLGKGAKANHLTYLGDAVVGAGANIGAGTVTCNYDGTTKYQTNIGVNAVIGSNSSLVAPVTVGDGAYVAAASCITEDVPADALAVARTRQTVKPEWAAKKRKNAQKSYALKNAR
jgi:bifunctional UDP-N-acetylglucosamine pyrophosphorylase/glucosamine-1-phosphate N-acetyltransferase